MFTVSSGFIGDFKTGDNIGYNLKSLNALYSAQNAASPSEARLFCKPITITMVSIIEALLHDLFFRIQSYTSEGVKNIADQVLNDIRSKTLDQLQTYIAAAKKHDLLGASGTDLYEKLDELRKVRNRVHIQNVKKQLDANESQVFTPSRQKSTEELLERVLKHVSNKYERPEHVHGHVDNFDLPWEEHLKPDSSK
ncbi:hypothetical protein Q667_11855 [Marinobacter sp. C1S70]|uniref:hypothetical protein n=1 Tax=Marinobacter sp. C1S70 TaxID=1396859 RepID=UPI0003B8C3C5|nr:hypothetical protein [Marinobacter sp. C1S70]ERS89650.1 hypothetical protein Q667_11855 [Marinobacter sp. C1S70]